MVIKVLQVPAFISAPSYTLDARGRSSTMKAREECIAEYIKLTVWLSVSRTRAAVDARRQREARRRWEQTKSRKQKECQRSSSNAHLHIAYRQVAKVFETLSYENCSKLLPDYRARYPTGKPMGENGRIKPMPLIRSYFQLL